MLKPKHVSICFNNLIFYFSYVFYRDNITARYQGENRLLMGPESQTWWVFHGIIWLSLLTVFTMLSGLIFNGILSYPIRWISYMVAFLSPQDCFLL